MTKPPLTLNGQPVGRLRASWLLTKEAFRFFKSDPEMLWVPVITGFINLLLFAVLVGGVFVFVLGWGIPFMEDESFGVAEYGFVFISYVISAFTLALSEAAMTHIVYTRMRGGDSTLMEALRAAFSYFPSLLLWSCITSTVGLLLRIASDRSALLGKIITVLLGAAWGVLTYFVVPAMVIHKKSAFMAIPKSADVFKQTWGESLVSNISIGLVFLLAHFVMFLAMVGLVVMSVGSQVTGFIIAVVLLYILWLIFACLLQSALSGILKTLLYVYGSEGTVPVNFNSELLEKMLMRKNQSAVAPSANTVSYEQQSGPSAGVTQ